MAFSCVIVSSDLYKKSTHQIDLMIALTDMNVRNKSIRKGHPFQLDIFAHLYRDRIRTKKPEDMQTSGTDKIGKLTFH